MPHWRKATWALIVINVLMAVWVIGGISSTSHNCTGQTGDSLSACQAGTAIGAGIGITLLLVLWFVLLVVFGLIWIMSRPRLRQCPRCGTDVKKGLTVCKKCGHDFGAPAAPVASS